MDYESKIIVIEQALALVKSGDVIVTGLEHQKQAFL